VTAPDQITFLKIPVALSILSFIFQQPGKLLTARFSELVLSQIYESSIDLSRSREREEDKPISISLTVSSR